MQIVTALIRRLPFLNRYAVSFGVCIVAYPGHLPRNADERVIRSNGKPIVLNLSSDDRLGKLSNDSQLVAEVSIQSFEIGRKHYRRDTVLVSNDVPIVNIHHVRGLDEGVR